MHTKLFRLLHTICTRERFIGDKCCSGDGEGLYGTGNEDSEKTQVHEKVRSPAPCKSGF